MEYIESRLSVSNFDAKEYKEFKEYLLRLGEEEYRKFNEKLIPGTNHILGIRLPILRAMALKIRKGNFLMYLRAVTHEYFEETMLMGLVIGLIPCDQEELKLKKGLKFKELSSYIREFVSHINNWAVCDTFCASLKVTKRFPEQMYQLILPYANSNKEYELRFYIVMSLIYYIEDDHIEGVMNRLVQINSSYYYVNMALAWAYSMIYVKYPTMILNFLKQRKEELMKIAPGSQLLSNKFIIQKTISKICESRQVKEEEKEIVRMLRI